jgi:hypothetical protein
MKSLVEYSRTMFPKDIWELLLQKYFDCRSWMNCFRASKSIRRFMSLEQRETCARYEAFKSRQKAMIQKKTNYLQFGVCSVCGTLADWRNLSKHQRQCRRLSPNLKTDFCDKCDTPLPYVTGLPHKPFSNVECPFSKIICPECHTSIFRVELGCHHSCLIDCFRCKVQMKATEKDAHKCLNRCEAIVSKSARSSKNQLAIQCSRKPVPLKRFCFQHIKKMV